MKDLAELEVDRHPSWFSSWLSGVRGVDFTILRKRNGRCGTGIIIRSGPLGLRKAYLSKEDITIQEALMAILHLFDNFGSSIGVVSVYYGNEAEMNTQVT